MCLGTESQRQVSQNYPKLKIQKKTRDFWDRLQTSFVKPKNIKVDGYETFTYKQEKTETLAEIHCGFTELVVKCNFKCTACNDEGLEGKMIC